MLCLLSITKITGLSLFPFSKKAQLYHGVTVTVPVETGTVVEW